MCISQASVLFLPSLHAFYACMWGVLCVCVSLPLRAIFSYINANGLTGCILLCAWINAVVPTQDMIWQLSAERLNKKEGWCAGRIRNIVHKH